MLWLALCAGAVCRADDFDGFLKPLLAQKCAMCHGADEASGKIDFEQVASAAQLQRQPEGLVPLNRSLNCNKIRNTFAIKQAPWRGAIAANVKQYYARLRQQE